MGLDTVAAQPARPPKGLERYVVALEQRTTTVTEGDAFDDTEPRDATVTCEGHDFLRLATGHLSPVVGVLNGRSR